MSPDFALYNKRKDEVAQQINNQDKELISTSNYDELGQFEAKAVGNLASSSIRLQTIDYTYNVRGWLKNINQDTENDNDLFNFSLMYNDIADTTKKLYNGNISQTSWHTLNTDSSIKTYSYTYDALNRITSANGTNTDHYDLDLVAYDKNGNITALNRKGHTNIGATSFGTMDNLVYDYGIANGNKLLGVTDTGETTTGFKDGTNTGDDFTYDTNGNLLTDANKGITSISYNHLNLPTEVVFGSASNMIKYRYDATGVKLQKEVVENGNPPTVTKYANGFIYEQDELQFFGQPEGYVQKDGTGNFEYVYNYTDHLGNVRLSYSDNVLKNGIIEQNEIIEESHYYPFGLKMASFNNVATSTNPAQDYKYNGVELEESLGLNMYETDYRHYDPAIARFTTIDPVTHHSMSTYTAFDNNPVYWADPSGADSIYNWNTGQYVINGQVVSQDEAIAYAQNGGNADGSNNNSPDDNDEKGTLGFVRTGKGQYYNKEKNIYINFNNNQKVDEDTNIYLRAEGDLSIGTQTKDGGTLLGIGDKTNIGATISIGSIEVLATLDKTIVNISYVNDEMNLEDVLRSLTIEVDINKSYLGGNFSVDLNKNVDFGANVGPIKGYNGDRVPFALKLMETNASFLNIGGVDMIGVSGNLEIRFNKPPTVNLKKAKYRDRKKYTPTYIRR